MNNLDSFDNYIEQIFHDSSQLINNSKNLQSEIKNCIGIILESLKNDKKIVLFGNGGSAADAQHIAAEFVGRFSLERKSYPAIALTTDSSIITSISNDYSFEQIFSRQCESIVSKDDIVVGTDDDNIHMIYDDGSIGSVTPLFELIATQEEALRFSPETWEVQLEVDLDDYQISKVTSAFSLNNGGMKKLEKPTNRKQKRAELKKNEDTLFISPANVT